MATGQPLSSMSLQFAPDLGLMACSAVEGDDCRTPVSSDVVTPGHMNAANNYSFTAPGTSCVSVCASTDLVDYFEPPVGCSWSLRLRTQWVTGDESGRQWVAEAPPPLVDRGLWTQLLVSLLIVVLMEFLILSGFDGV